LHFSFLFSFYREDAVAEAEAEVEAVAEVVVEDLFQMLMSSGIFVSFLHRHRPKYETFFFPSFSSPSNPPARDKVELDSGKPARRTTHARAARNNAAPYQKQSLPRSVTVSLLPMIFSFSPFSCRSRSGTLMSRASFTLFLFDVFLPLRKEIQSRTTLLWPRFVLSVLLSCAK
jgi:hypothetical protein